VLLVINEELENVVCYIAKSLRDCNYDIAFILGKAGRCNHPRQWLYRSIDLNMIQFVIINLCYSLLEMRRPLVHGQSCSRVTCVSLLTRPTVYICSQEKKT